MQVILRCVLVLEKIGIPIRYIRWNLNDSPVY